MRLSHLSFRIKITSGFGSILLLFIVGLGMSVLGMNKISGMMELSNKANQLSREMLQAREYEKEYLIHKKGESVERLNQNIINSRKLITDIKSGVGNEALLAGLTGTGSLVEEYQGNFGQTVENTNEIERLRTEMRRASDTIFETIDKKIREPILEIQNMAIVTGEASNPVLDEVLIVAEQLLMNLKDARSYENAFALYEDPKYVKKFSDKVMCWEKTKDDFGYLVNTANDKELNEAYATIERQFETYNGETLNNVLSLWEINNRIRGSMQSKGEEIGKIVRQLQQETEGEMVRAKNLTVKVAVVLLGSGILSGLLLTYFIVRSTTRPINQVVNGLKDIAEGEGDLTTRLDAKSKDEIGQLANWFNSFMDKLQEMIKDIAGNAETLNTSSANLSSLSGRLSSGADNMSGKSSALAASAEEMDSNMNSVAATMEEAAINVGVVATSAGEMTNTINEIAQNADKARAITGEAVSEAKEASDNVHELGKAAKEISKVTEAITEISEQTKLLALNATIEAARAGEAGKGFAVVANEIKELARQTAEATQDIEKRIEGIQGSTAGTVSRIEQISKVINEVNEIVTTIATAVEEQSVTTREIANNVDQAAQGIQEVNENVAQSSTVAGEIAKDISEVNQAASEMSNSSSQVNMSVEGLSNLAEQLKKMVNRFKV